MTRAISKVVPAALVTDRSPKMLIVRVFVFQSSLVSSARGRAPAVGASSVLWNSAGASDISQRARRLTSASQAPAEVET